MINKRHRSLAVRARRAERTLVERLRRLAHYRLVIPMKRSHHAPEHTARGVMVGVVVGLTPTVGIQMAIALVVWLIARRLFRWDFNVVLAVAWTWISNMLTMVPMYYAFYVTGQAMLGHWSEMWGYHTFADQFARALHPAHLPPDPFGYFSDASGGGALASLAGFFLKDLFLVMLLGSVPYWPVGGWLAYRWSLRFTERHRAARARRQAQRRAHRPQRPDRPAHHHPHAHSG